MKLISKRTWFITYSEADTIINHGDKPRTSGLNNKFNQTYYYFGGGGQGLVI